MSAEIAKRQFPRAARILFGLGLGGFFDGIVLHQVLQWHHMLSSWYPITSVETLELNNLWDGIFHSITYLFVLAGLVILWRAAHKQHLLWSTRVFIGTLMLGFGMFNVIEGAINHHILGLHQVNELVDHSQRFAWDIAFVAWGAAMIAGGWHLAYRAPKARAS